MSFKTCFHSLKKSPKSKDFGDYIEPFKSNLNFKKFYLKLKNLVF